MKSHKSDYKKVENTLITAYRDKDGVEPGDYWQMRVMNHVRSLGPLSSETSLFMLFDQVVWRFAFVACLLAVILSAYVLQTGFQPEYQLANLFVNDSVELTFLQYFEI